MKNYSSQLLNLNPIIYDNALLAIIQKEIDKEKTLKEEKQFFFDALSDLINGLAKHDIFIHISKDLTERDALFELLNLGCTNKLSYELEKIAVYAYARYNNERYHKNIIGCITSVCDRVYCAEENNIYQELVNNLVQNHKYLFLENSYAPTTPEAILALDSNVQLIKDHQQFNQLNLDFILDFKFYFDSSSNKGNFTVFELENASTLSDIDRINELFQHFKTLTWINDFKFDKENNCFYLDIEESKFNFFAEEIIDNTYYLSVESVGYQRRGFTENSRFYNIIDSDNHNAETTELEKFIESVQPFLYGDSSVMQQAFRHMQKQFERNTPIQEWKLDSNGIIFFSW